MNIFKRSPVMVVLVVVSILVVGVVVEKSRKQSDNPEFATMDSDMFDFKTVSETPEITPDQRDTPEKLLKTALTEKNVIVRCPVSSSEMQGMLYLSGESVRFTGHIQRSELYEEMTDILSIKKSVYMWNGETKQGYIMPSLGDRSLLIPPNSNKNGEVARAFSRMGIDIRTCAQASYTATLFKAPDYVNFTPFRYKVEDYIRDQVNKVIDGKFGEFFKG